MKIAAHQLGPLLKDPGQVAGILFYGEDTGRIRDHVAAATRSVIGDKADPFRSCVLMREEHARLRDEVTSLSLGGGRRVVRVQDATDAMAGQLEGLAGHRADTLVLLEAGMLPPRSKLRGMAEKHPNWAAVAYYPEAGHALTAEIKRVLAEAALSADPATLAYLTQELGGDSGRRRAELDKLCLYGAGAGTLSLEMAQACCAVGLDATLGAAVSAALLGHGDRCDKLLDELGRDGATGPGVLAVLTNQMQRILKVRLLMADGTSADEACRGLQPPVFPRQMPGFLQEVQRWPIPQLEALGRAVREADLACKRAASPDMAIAGRLLSVIASRGNSPA